MNKFDQIWTARLMSLLLIIACLSFELVGAIDTQVQIDQSIEASDKQEDQSSAQTILQESNAIQASFQFNLNFQHVIVEIVETGFEKVIVPDVVDQFIPSVSKTFKILLQHIISCNAP